VPGVVDVALPSRDRTQQRRLRLGPNKQS
jgi:hypothetical protein